MSEDEPIHQDTRWRHKKTKRTALVLHGTHDDPRWPSKTVMYRYEKPAPRSKNTRVKSAFVSTCTVLAERFRKTFAPIKSR